MQRRIGIMLLITATFSLVLSACNNSSVELPDLTITASGDNHSSSEVTFKISADPTIVSGGMVNATVVANGSLTALSYKNDDINNQEYTLTASATSSAWTVECQVRVNNGDLETGKKEWTGHLGRDYPAKTIDFYFKCNDLSALTVKAEHAQGPVAVNLQAEKKNSELSVKVLPPLNLLSSNQFTRQVKLAPKTRYKVTVKPMLDDHDQVAHFNQQVQSGDQKWVVDYEPSSAHLIASPSLNTEGIGSLPPTVKQAYNTVVWQGVELNKNALQLTSDSQMGFDQGWRQAQAQLRPYPYIKSLLAIDHADQLSSQQYSALPGMLPKGLQMVQLNLSSIPANVVQAIQQWQQQYPRLQVIFNLTHALNDDDSARLKSLLSTLTQTPSSNKTAWQGWVQVPLLQIQTMKSVVPAQYLVVAMPTKLSSQSDQQYLASYPKADVIGMSLPLNQVEDMLALKSRVLVADSH